MTELRKALGDKWEPSILRARELSMFGIPCENMSQKELKACLGWLYEEYKRVDAERWRLSSTQFDWARKIGR